MPATALRWTGVLATAILAVGAYLAGALPGGDTAIATRDGQPRALAGTAVWLAGAVLLAAVWWRLPRTDLRWLLTTGALWAVPLLVAPPLGSRDVYAYACQGFDYLHGGGCPWLAAVPEIWRDAPAPYGPAGILTSAAAVAPAQGHVLVAVGLLRLVALAGALLLTGYVVSLARRLGLGAAEAAWLGAITPLVAVHAVSGAHHDALVAGLLVAGLALAAREYPVAAGLAAGLAVSVKVTAIVALPFAVLLVVRPGRWSRGAALVGAAVVAYAVPALLGGLGLGWLRGLGRTGDLVQWSSPPTAIGMAVGYGLRLFGVDSTVPVTITRIAGLAVLAVVLVALWWRARGRPPREIVLAAGAALAATAVLGPVFYPWYAIAPLAVLAASTVDDRVRRALAVATIALGFLVLPSGLGVPVLTKLPGALLVTAAVVWGVTRWVRSRGPAPAA